jgi:Zn finger protein HypA/HybF involved in hydrogenase expression
VPIKIIRKMVCECSRCSKQWTPRINTNDIVLCPRCKSPYWNKKRKQKKIRNEIL